MAQEHWAAYYRGGALVSCPTTPDPNYTMEVRDAWVSLFSGLSDGARILDLGTGNGPVALIAKETATEPGREFEIDAVDLADIDPPRYVAGGDDLFAGIRFRGGISTEALPFDDALFDAVSGQYIVEYTDIDKTFAEAARVLSSGGRCQFILHHDESLVVRNALESLQHAEFALRDRKMLRRLDEYINATDPRKSTAARNRLFASGGDLQAAAIQARNPLFLQYVVDSIRQLLQHEEQLGRGGLLKQAKRLDAEIRHWKSRLDDLVAAARSSADMEDIVRRADASGFTDVAFEVQFQDRDNIVGWRLTMSRP